MNTFFDLLRDSSFRTYVERRLAVETKNPEYSFPSAFPALYKYRPLSEYAVNDILSGQMTATNISIFNDLFDGTIHGYSSKEERIQAAENKWNELEKLYISTGISNSLKHDEYVDICSRYFLEESRLKFRALEYLGTYICCLSTKFDSTLMWAHYAGSNTGICIEYDFNASNLNSLQKSMIFPVAYSQNPADISDLLADDRCKVYTYPLEAAILCAALNKAIVWNYENEWRLVLVLPTEKPQKRFETIMAPSIPKSVILGYHFLKPFFYYDHKNTEELVLAKESIHNIVRLLAYIKNQGIPISIMIPSIRGYALSRKSLDVDALLKLIKYHFDEEIPEDIRFYYVVHDELMDLLES